MKTLKRITSPNRTRCFHLNLLHDCVERGYAYYFADSDSWTIFKQPLRWKEDRWTGKPYLDIHCSDVDQDVVTRIKFADLVDLPEWKVEILKDKGNYVNVDHLVQQACPQLFESA